MAEEGNRGSYYNLGNLYLKGRGVRLNLLEAYKWFLLADRAGLPQAKVALRRMNKVMTPADKKEANLRVLRWYDLHPKTRR
ncbi:MAG: sel1 repeat family protein [Rhodospirillales bacterium]|nr:sel1 repeat family protein [Rhodospirillales bacterium]MBT5075313.1 sel1 repeat family protein [Rhodospirillales bacterium]MBT5112922.1 sel1 repeat family protein [Rhodospirillales bacterium]MBT5673693.1 sel1 repeat family protein [Rhodospirillales bacterium]MBT6186351.1 sel1 repeat family protein [Rhodospirillales bacterium]